VSEPLVLKPHFESRHPLFTSILSGSHTVFRIESLGDEIEHQLNLVVAALLQKYHKEHLQSTVYSCLKELVVNAFKANAKQVFFEEKQLDPHQQDQYEKGIADFKDQISEAWIQEYSLKALQRGMIVEIAVEHNEDGLRFEVINTGGIAFEDEKRIRDKFARGMQCEDLVSFYLDNADNTEGEGIGFALNVLLLKGEDINPALFRVGSREGLTVARLEIPFTDNFVSVRGDDPGPKS
jgi:hypothetical protein